MDPNRAPEVKEFLLGCLVAQCEQSPSVALQVRDDVGITRVFPTNILTSTSSCWHRFLFFSCLLPPRRMDRCRPSDTADRSAPETVGPGFRRRPSSVLPARLGNRLTPCGERAGGPSAKGSTYIHQHWGGRKEMRNKILDLFWEDTLSLEKGRSSQSISTLFSFFFFK